MPVVKTPRGVFEVFGAPVEGKYPITGYEIERHITWGGEGAEFFPNRVVREPASAEEVQALRANSDAVLTGQLQELSALNADLQRRLDLAESRRDEALATLETVRLADRSYNEVVRPRVAHALRDRPE